MFRALLIPILIASVLACPLRCTSCAAGVAGWDGGVPAACACCQPKRPVQPTSTDDQSDNECRCPNCICEGATIAAGPQVSDGATLSVCVGHWQAAENEHVRGVIAQYRLKTITSGQRLYCARDALVAHQSWQL